MPCVRVPHEVRDALRQLAAGDVADGDVLQHGAEVGAQRDPDQEERRGGTAIVASGDRDAFQLASERTTILQPIKAGEMARIGPAEVRERYGVEPRQVPDFIALRGDPSDRLPGARGVGPKGAAALLRKYPTLEDAFADGQLASQAEALRLYRHIATMDATAPLPLLDDQIPTWAKAAALAREWELNRLAARLDELAAAQI